MGLFALLVAELFLFRAVARRHYAWTYPRWVDQVQYLSEAYGTFQAAQREGVLHGAMSAFERLSPQGTLHGLLALPVFALLGPSRLSALTVNMLAFLGWQLATFAAVRRTTGRSSLGWAAVGLLAATRFPWAGIPGGAFDFRLDWMAVCAYGTALAAAESSRGFRSTLLSALFGTAVGAAVLIRYLTLVYFGLIFAVLFVWLALRPERAGRILRLMLAGGLALAIAGPSLIHARHALYDYYWAGHIAGPERALRDTHLGPFASLNWFLAELFPLQMGWGAVGLGLSAAAALAMSPKKTPEAGVHPRSGRPDSDGWVTALGFLGVPAAVLGSHPIKSTAPASILLPGAIWVFILLWRQCALGRERACGWVAAGVLAAGAFLFARVMTATEAADARIPDFRTINAVCDFVHYRAEERGWDEPRLAVTGTLDGLSAGAFNVSGYERHARMPRFLATLPMGLLYMDPDTVMKALDDSDLVLLVTRSARAWPFDQEMAQLLPRVRAWCESHRTQVGTFSTADCDVVIYERADASGRPYAGDVTLGSLETAEGARSADAPAVVPALPRFVSAVRAPASTLGDFRFVVFAAHDTLRYGSARLPEGLRLDPGSGVITGRCTRKGRFVATLTATNTVGTTTAPLTLDVGETALYASASAPDICRQGVPVDFGFEAFDLSGTLNFIDVTDLTAGRALARIEAVGSERTSWSGGYRATFREAGTRLLLFRFVCFNPGTKAYTYLDRDVRIDVGREAP